MNEVELLAICPVIFCVIHFKPAVRGHTGESVPCLFFGEVVPTIAAEWDLDQFQ
jgi:hypothetical protein